MLAAVLVPWVLAASLVLGAPAVLTRGRWQVLRPRLGLTLWFTALAMGCVGALASVLVATVATVSPNPDAGAAEISVVAVFAWATLGGLGAAATYVVTSAEPLVAADGQVRALTAVATSREQRAGFVLIRVRSAQPLVCAAPGREPAIWISDGAERLLSRGELQAVLAHEYAHLRGRHHWAARVAALNARCLPRVLPAGRALQRATSLLVELIADDVAARQAGPAELANALTKMAGATGASGMALRAERLTRRRWPRRSRRRMPQAVQLPA